jgi:hypothetical protein
VPVAANRFGGRPSCTAWLEPAAMHEKSTPAAYDHPNARKRRVAGTRPIPGSYFLATAKSGLPCQCRAVILTATCASSVTRWI